MILRTRKRFSEGFLKNDYYQMKNKLRRSVPIDVKENPDKRPTIHLEAKQSNEKESSEFEDFSTKKTSSIYYF